MIQLETELKELKSELIHMWHLVRSQLIKAEAAFINFDKDLAREVTMHEKRVNAYEIKIDRDFEDIFALYSPVAVDLRFVLAALKINNNLERIGDIAESIARYVIDASKPFDENIMTESRVQIMYRDSVNILIDALEAFETENTQLARTIFKKDETLNEINSGSVKKLSDIIKQNPNIAEEALYILSIIRKLERVGDQCTNIAEETIFFIEAKVLKHPSGGEG
jgi:phosphate transport system protein